MWQELVEFLSGLKFWQIWLGISFAFAIYGFILVSRYNFRVRMFCGRINLVLYKGSVLCFFFISVYYFFLWPWVCYLKFYAEYEKVATL